MSYLISIHGCQLHNLRAVSDVLLHGEIQSVCWKHWRVVVDILKRYFYLQRKKEIKKICMRALPKMQTRSPRNCPSQKESKTPKKQDSLKEGYKIFIGTNKDNQTASNLLMVNNFKWSQWNSDWKMFPKHCPWHPPKGLRKLGAICLATMTPVDTGEVVKTVLARNDCTVAAKVCGKEGYSPIV